MKVDIDIKIGEIPQLYKGLNLFHAETILTGILAFIKEEQKRRRKNWDPHPVLSTVPDGDGEDKQ